MNSGKSAVAILNFFLLLHISFCYYLFATSLKKFKFTYITLFYPTPSAVVLISLFMFRDVESYVKKCYYMYLNIILIKYFLIP